MKHILYALAFILVDFVFTSCGDSKKESHLVQSVENGSPPSPPAESYEAKTKLSSMEEKTPGSVSGNYYSGNDESTITVSDNSTTSYFYSTDVSADAVSTTIPKNEAPVPQQQNSTLQQNMQRMLVQTGYIEYETKDVTLEKEKINSALLASGGYISNETQRQLPNGVRQEITLRMPADKFMSVVNDVKAGIGKFAKMDIRANDVTEEFLDICARLKTKKEMEERFRALLLKATKISEVLEIEREINALREEIESTEGRMQFLSNQAQFSTLTIVYYTVLAPADIKKDEENRFLKALKNGWEGFVVFLVNMVKIWPLLIVAFGVFYLVRRYLKKHEKKAAA
jgi:hypothetical protein